MKTKKRNKNNVIQFPARGVRGSTMSSDMEETTILINEITEGDNSVYRGLVCGGCGEYQLFFVRQFDAAPKKSCYAIFTLDREGSRKMGYAYGDAMGLLNTTVLLEFGHGKSRFRIWLEDGKVFSE